MAANSLDQNAIGRVTSIDTIRWEAQPNLLWVLVRTSNGAVGLGETYYLPRSVEAVIHELAAELLVGESAATITQHWNKLFSYVGFFGSAGAEMRAISALDIALWDAFGQVVSQPIYQLLGGACRTTIPVYNTCVNAGPYLDWNHALEDAGSLASELRSNGYLGLKLWPWDRFAPQIESASSTGPAGWQSMGPSGNYLSIQDLSTGLEMLEKVRDSVGNSIEILVEGHSRWDINMALRICRAVEPLSVLWMEDIIQPDSPDDLARLVKESRVPQAVSERLISRFPFREALERAAAHVILIDVAWTGGITEARRIAELAGTYHLSFAPHDCTGPVTALANIHLAASQPNCIALEVVRGFIEGYYQDVLDLPLSVLDGTLSIPGGSGLGSALQPDFMHRPDVTVLTTSEKHHPW